MLLKWQKSLKRGLKSSPGDRIASLTDLINSVIDFPDASKKFPSSDFMYSDMDCYNYINALANMPNAPYALKQKSLVSKGVVKKGLVIAASLQGEKSLRLDILELIKNPEEQAILRIMAVGSLEQIGLKEDIDFLESIAENDTVVRTRHEGVGPSSTYFPVREAAKQAIGKLKKKLIVN